MKKILLVLLCVGSVMAFADEDGGGYYAGAAVGLGWAKTDKTTLAGRVDAGYLINDSLSAELGVTDITPWGSGKNKHNIAFIDLALKYTMPINETYSVYALGGGAYGMSSKIDNYETNLKYNGFAGVVGIGGAYNLNEQASITLGDSLYIGSNTVYGKMTNVALLGLNYNFN